MVDHKNLDGLTAICRRKGASISCTRRRGLSHFTNSVWTRPVLLGSIGFLLFLTLWLPERVLFVSVDGYASVSPLEILNAAQQCGIRFGATRSLVRSEEVKNALLGVEKNLLEEKGAVSAPVAEAMAKGARARLNADIAVSVTGLAGPGGDDFGNPVGTVFLGYADDKTAIWEEHHFTGDREAVRAQAAEAALALILKNTH